MSTGTTAAKRLDIERQLITLPETTRVRVVTRGKENYAVIDLWELNVGSLLVKSGGKRKRGDQLVAPVRKEVLKVLAAGGTVGYSIISHGEGGNA